MTVIKPIQEFNLITSEPIKSITETKLCIECTILCVLQYTEAFIQTLCDLFCLDMYCVTLNDFTENYKILS